MKPSTFLFLILSFVETGSAMAAGVTYSGSDTDGSLVQANLAFQQFEQNAGLLSVIDFEAFTPGRYFSSISQNGVDIIPSGVGGNFDIIAGAAAGAFPISGNQFIANNTNTDEITFDFHNSVSAFGFYATDQENEVVTVNFTDGSELNFNLPALGANGSDAFFGYVSDSASIASVKVSDNGLFVGYDDFYYSTVVPIPAAVWLFGSGLGLLGWFRRKQIA